MPSRTVHTVCSHDCPDSCGVLVTVDELTGRATKVQGDPSHPVTQGFLCGKVAKYLERVYAPDRLLYPMKRKAGVAKGSLKQGEEIHAFERIPWDEALDTVALKLAAISKEHGPESILPYSYAGTIGQLGYGSMDRRFFYRLGASQLDRTICSTAGEAAMLSVYGTKLGTETEDFRLAKLILAWGGNIHGNNIHLWPFVEEARRNGAKLIVIDPYKTRTARAADWHIAIRPGTDSALALGLMHVIVAEGLHDVEYIAKYTHGFEQLRERIADYTPARVAEWTGIAAEDIVRLAREYATAKPAAIRLNYGIQRGENGGTAARTVAMLPCITGAWQHRGGGLQLSTSGAYAFNKNALQMPELMLASPLGRGGRTINMSQLGMALTQAEDPPVKALFVYNSNPAAVAPNQNDVLRGMRRDDLFIVVHEQFFTDTADYADILLPATTFLEHTDVQGAYGHYYAQLSQKAIEPLGEARSNVWLFGQLGQRIGFSEACFRETEEDLVNQALATDHPWMQGITRERLEKEGHAHLKFSADDEPFLPFSGDGWCQTPSGKAEFYSETLAAQGKDPLPAYVPATESRNHSPNAQFPLEMLARKADNYMNSTFANLPGHQQMEAATSGLIEMHASDAGPRGIQNGDEVEVFNARGVVKLQAKVNGSVPAGVVAARLGWNKLSAGGAGVNVLTSERLTDLGGGATFYSTLVEVRKAAPVES
ncbi:MAG: molybdopterin-containing oxidoreductase family protein [Acidobacteriaceae bacterium]